MIAVVAGSEPEAHDIGPGARFTHRKRAKVLARDELGQIGLSLRFRAPAIDLVHAQIRVRAVAEADGR